MINRHTLIIASGGTISNSIVLNGRSIIKWDVPTLTGTSLAIHGKTVAGTFVAIQDKDGTALALATPSAKIVRTAPSDVYGEDEIKVISNGTEAAERTIYAYSDSFIE